MQSLQSGISYVTRWLVVKVVWWDLRPEWCELLYRHRVINCRLEQLILPKLNAALNDMATLLPQVGMGGERGVQNLVPGWEREVVVWRRWGACCLTG